jgi:hypothetical protein
VTPYSFITSKGKTVYLHSREVQLKSGKSSRIFFFSGVIKPDSAVSAIPDGYEVAERGNLVLLKKAAA